VSLLAETLVCRRGETTVFRDLSFAVPAGGALLLVGRNGSGKSSLLRLCAGLIAPAGGRLAWQGRAQSDDADAWRGRVAYVGHLDAVKAAFSVVENLSVWASLAGGAGDVAGAMAAMDIAGLRDVPARYLSAGQRRRVALARLALSPAPIWLLDEPAVSLDADGVAALGRLIAGRRATGGVVLAATHGDISIPDAATLRLGGAP